MDRFGPRCPSRHKTPSGRRARRDGAGFRRQRRAGVGEIVSLVAGTDVRFVTGALRDRSGSTRRCRRARAELGAILTDARAAFGLARRTP